MTVTVRLHSHATVTVTVAKRFPGHSTALDKTSYNKVFRLSFRVRKHGDE